MGNVPLIRALQSIDDRVDLRFKSSENDEDGSSDLIETSKAFLSHISPVLKVAFTTGFKETHAHGMLIDNFGVEDMNIFLHFAAMLCFPKLPVEGGLCDNAKIIRLLPLAEFYQSKIVLDELIKYIKDGNCDNATIIRLLPIAEFYQSRVVLDELIMFINKKPASGTCIAAEQAAGGLAIKWQPHVYSSLVKEVWTKRFVQCCNCETKFQTVNGDYSSKPMCAKPKKGSYCLNLNCEESKKFSMHETMADDLEKLSRKTLVKILGAKIEE